MQFKSLLITFALALSASAAAISDIEARGKPVAGGGSHGGKREAAPEPNKPVAGGGSHRGKR
ncbi:hypothetical protein HYALB_00006577 [Hymenoscyphus albidus]|uniref:Uncharacterized protein n=1 Tax=Hymenoscyphus albidus TaxID=595503 RepID=A0A9N9QB32_9HELO|nr:hypothetical protein HYALB_00006577 [Hymenoscyphus albidus]